MLWLLLEQPRVQLVANRPGSLTAKPQVLLRAEDLLRLRYEYSVLPLIEEIFYDRPEIVEKNFGYDALITEIASEASVETAGNQTPSAI